MNHRVAEALGLAALLAAVVCAVQGLWLAWDLREIARMLGGEPNLTEPHQWLAAATGLLGLALGLGGWQQVLRRQALGPLRRLSLDQLGTPQVSQGQLLRLSLEAFGPLALAAAALPLSKALIDRFAGQLGPWSAMGLGLGLIALLCVLVLPWLLRRLVRLSGETRMEPLFNWEGVQRLRRSTVLPQCLVQDEPVLESFTLGHPGRLWLVMTPTRLLCLTKTWSGDRLVRELPLSELSPRIRPPATGLWGRAWDLVLRRQAAYQLQHPLWLSCQSGADLHGALRSGSVCRRVLTRLGQADRPR